MPYCMVRAYHYNRIIIIVISISQKCCQTYYHCVCVSCLLFFRVQRKVVSLCVYRDGDWLLLERTRERYDSINTLVMHRLTRVVPISIGNHKILVNFRYPVHSSKYYS